MTFLDGKGVCLILIGKKIESHYFFIESPDFFSWVSGFSFIRGWQVCIIWKAWTIFEPIACFADCHTIFAIIPIFYTALITLL